MGGRCAHPLSRLHEQLRGLQPLPPDGTANGPALPDDTDGMRDGGDVDEAGAGLQ